MDWRYNTIWLEQIDRDKIVQFSYKDGHFQDDSVNSKEYGIIWYFKHKGRSFEDLPDMPDLRYLQVNWGNTLDFNGIAKFKKLKRLELHYCTKIKTDRGLASLKDSLEFLHISRSKKFELHDELLQLKNLRVLCLNACGPIDNLKFLNCFPNLIDFRFVDTNVLSGDLTPIVDHPTIKTVGFLNKRHYNFSDKQIDEKLKAKSKKPFKEFVHKGQYVTYKYKYRDDQ